VSPRINMDAVENREILLFREPKPGHPARSQSPHRLSYLGYLFSHVCSTLSVCDREKINADHFLDLYVFSAPEHIKLISGMLSICMYVCVRLAEP
jgi:hypothetical protein